MEKFRLTNEKTWEQHWSNKNNIQYVPDNYCYHEFFKRFAEKLPPNGTCIELGGFPGKFSIFFKKYYNLNPTLIDFHFDKNIFNNLLNINGLVLGQIKTIQADIFTHKPENQYDMVCSFGLIEHFTDLEEILKVHKKYMKPDALLLITLPNFKGLNGAVQKYFDPSNLAIHNKKIMSISVLENALTNVGFVDVEVGYHPGTGVWIENLDQRGLILNLTVRILTRFTIYAGKIFGMKNRLLSNSILISARSQKVK